MRISASVCLAISCLAMSVATAERGLAQDASGPEQVVRDFIKEFYSDDSLKNFRSKANAKKFFTPSSSKKIIAQSKKDIDADFIVEAQDFQLKKTNYSVSDASDKTASVVVKFENFEKQITNNFKMENVGGKWFIQDVCKPDKSCLLKL